MQRHAGDEDRDSKRDAKGVVNWFLKFDNVRPLSFFETVNF